MLLLLSLAVEKQLESVFGTEDWKFLIRNVDIGYPEICFSRREFK